MNKWEQIKKLVRFIRIYGFHRSVFKAVGRTRLKIRLVTRRYPEPDVSMIGCGQFGLTTIGYFISRKFGNRFRKCYDLDEQRANSFAHVLGGVTVEKNVDAVLSDEETRVIYIASNHCSHAKYAAEALMAGKAVYVEKPVCVDRDQLRYLRRVSFNNNSKIYAGYNRPFSKFILELKRRITSPKGGLSLCCFVSGHKLSADHWYRSPEEGTRICGNAGHWIDLFMHMLFWRGRLPTTIKLQFLNSDVSDFDDNFVLSIRTSEHDIFSLMLTSRNEPFEGINETINIQWGDFTAKIDDFRHMTVWHGNSVQKIRAWPKDVGHEKAILQPFQNEPRRGWHEILLSSAVMLHVTEMARSGEESRVIKLERDIENM